MIYNFKIIYIKLIYNFNIIYIKISNEDKKIQ
mgnify:CR=1 FL=1